MADDVAEVRQVPHRAAGTLGQVGVDDQLAAHARLGLLARREDVGDDGLVGEGQRLAELALQVARAREEVRLEDGDHTSVGACLGSLQRGGDLSRVVGVVVDDHDAVAAPQLLVATGGAAEGGQVGRRLVEAHTGVRERAERGQRVEHVVLARHAQLDAPQPLAALAHDERTAAVVDALDVGREIAAIDAVGHDGRSRGLEQERGRRLLGEHQKAPRRQQRDEAPEHVAHLVETAVVGVVVELDVGHHGHLGTQEEEAAVALVGLGDEPLALTNAGV